jgi:hypothetical protein
VQHFASGGGIAACKREIASQQTCVDSGDTVDLPGLGLALGPALQVRVLIPEPRPVCISGPAESEKPLTAEEVESRAREGIGVADRHGVTDEIVGQRQGGCRMASASLCQPVE